MGVAMSAISKFNAALGGAVAGAAALGKRNKRQTEKDALEQKKIESQISRNKAVASKLRADARSKNFKTKRDKALFNAQQNINDKFEQNQTKRVDSNNTSLSNRNINQLVQEDYYNKVNIKNLSNLSDDDLNDIFDEAYSHSNTNMYISHNIDKRNFSDEEKQQIVDEMMSRKAKSLGLTLDEYKQREKEAELNEDVSIDDIFNDDEEGGKQ